MPIYALTLAAILAAAPDSPAEVRGWMVHGTDRPYLTAVLEAAGKYGINHLEMAGDNPTFSEELIQQPRQTALIEEIAKAAKAKGIRTYVWIREFNVRDKSQDMDPSSTAGAAFWKGRLDALRAGLKLIPDISGVVMSYASTPTEIWDVKGQDAFWSGMSQAQRVRYTTDRFKDVVVGEFHKRMLVRDFNHSPNQLHWLNDGLKDEDGIIMHSKDVPQDWQFFYPHSFTIGAYGKTPQVIEFDLTGEYWGQALVPVSLVEYIKYRWDYDRTHGARGMVGRIDRDENRELGTPSEINVYAHSVYMRHPATSVQAVYDGWNRQRYGLKAGSPASRRLTEIYRRCIKVAKLQYYTLGFWAPKNQTLLPEKLSIYDNALRGKSSAQWDPAAKATESDLLNPTPEVTARIFADKDKAVALSAQNLSEFAALKSAMKPADYEEFEAQLRFMHAQAQVWRAMSRAIWTTKLALKGGSASDAETEIGAFSEELAKLENPAAPRFVAVLKLAGESLAGDLRKQLATK